MADPKALTRAELAQFLPTPRAIKAFEQLFDLVPAEVIAQETLIQETSILAASAGSAANQALGELTRIADALELLSLRPKEEHFNTVALDYIDFNTTINCAEKVGRVAWNDIDDTLNIYHSGGVVQQVGEELYLRVINNTGTAIANGSCVGFAGVSGTIEIQKYIADGTIPMLYAIGITTEDIADGEIGRASVWGHVRGINTTGTPVSETWAVGDILYASPTTAGALTNISPTADNVSIPMAAVLTVSSTAGEIFVRPTIEQKEYYGHFTKTSDQSPAAINTAYAITFDSTENSNGISIGTPASRIVASNAGLYLFDVSYQITSTNASIKNVYVWFRKNGTDIPNTTRIVSLESATALSTPSFSLTISLADGEYVELMYASDDVNVTLDASAATGFSPAAPSVTLLVNQTQQ